MHPLLLKIRPTFDRLAANNSHVIECINLNPADCDELGIHPQHGTLWGVKVVRDPNRPRGSALIGTTQDRQAFLEDRERDH